MMGNGKTIGAMCRCKSIGVMRNYKSVVAKCRDWCKV